MKYKSYDLVKVKDSDVDGGSYYEIYKNGELITQAWSLDNAKEFIDSGLNYNVLC